MNKSTNKELIMPSNFIAMDSEEMTYVEGGKVHTTYKTLKEADKAFRSMMAGGSAGTVASGIASFFSMGIAAPITAYTGYITHLCRSCWNKTQHWLDSGVASDSWTKTKLTTYCWCPTNLTVSLC